MLNKIDSISLLTWIFVLVLGFSLILFALKAGLIFYYLIAEILTISLIIYNLERRK